MDQERRQVPRFSFIATAEVIEERSEARIATRVSELSSQGCYLDMMNPFPSGTSVLVKIWEGENYFEARAKIAYADDHLGVGIAFLEVADKFAPVLLGWLNEAERRRKLSEN
jgi:PilZ domain